MFRLIKNTTRAGALTAALLFAGGCETTNQTSLLSYAAPADATDDFDAAAGRAPTAATLYRMGNILAAQSNFAKAEAVYRSTIHRYPGFRPAYCRLAAVQLKQGRPLDAIETIDVALEDAPNDAVLRNDRGMCLMLMERYPEARHEFQMAVDADPENTRYTGNMALAAGMVGEYDEALDLYYTYLISARAHHNVGVICEARGDMVRAEREYAIALGRAPKPLRHTRYGAEAGTLGEEDVATE